MKSTLAPAPALSLLVALVAACAGLAPPPASADTLLIDRASVASRADLPRRGASMTQVAARYGAPVDKVAPVGGGSVQTPPITRWTYPTFSVYFENSHVVDAVVNKASPLEIGPAPAPPAASGG